MSEIRQPHDGLDMRRNGGRQNWITVIRVEGAILDLVVVQADAKSRLDLRTCATDGDGQAVGRALRQCEPLPPEPIEDHFVFKGTRAEAVGLFALAQVVTVGRRLWILRAPQKGLKA